MSGGERLRVSQHSGRQGSAKHNDRTFVTGRGQDWIEEHASHIDQERSENNLYTTWDGNPNFEESERHYYEQTYQDGLDATNAHYRHEGHADRCKSIDDLYTGKLTRPEEMILQIGDRSSGIDGQSFKAAVEDYLGRLAVWNDEHGGHMIFLTAAIHLDEGSPHAHIRRVWEYQDAAGRTRLGQNKALQAAGIEPPQPGKPLGRYNNRKMSFDAMARGIWQETCREHGFDIETEARPGMRHKEKRDFIYDQMTAEIDTARQEATRADAARQEAQQRAQEARQQAQETEGRLIIARAELEAIEERTHILTAKEVERMQSQHRGLFGLRLVRADDWNRVMDTARQAEDATRRADAIEQERDGILRQAREQAQELTQQATRERDAALQERDRARQQRDGLRKERDDLQRDVQEWIDRASDDRGVYLTGYLATERMASKLVAIMEYQDARQLMQIDRLMDDCIRQMPDYMQDELLRDIREQDNRLEEHKRAVKDLSDDLEL